ncbi:aminotransferase class V-fold PLP-dependent enzyme [Arthrobacter roseus]|uniref:aminotransferase class V-fold PLP-dependent enzyme n=1 Tax=Arthrobacter roseus TaxID=136274 RepID=UPI001963AF82|nr:aminotransferase class V-fold PLP-dependent enzyme [Arthrobacter roseus]MBM7846849.1 selenocysteine lyase/cysteine desulfurase [Arthrobacter roseus]
MTTAPIHVPAPDAGALLASYLEAFSEDRGYLNFARFGPPSRAVVDTSARLMETAMAGEVGVGKALDVQTLRAREAFARVSGFPLDRVALVPNTSLGLFQAAFGLESGSVLISSGEFPANLYPWLRNNRIGRAGVHVMGGPGVHVTPDLVAGAMSAETVAVAVSAVDFRTGFRADLAGIRDVIGSDRLLAVDGIQAFGAVDVDWSPADVLVTGGQKWVRAGWGAGGMAFSDAGLERIQPVLGGWTGVVDEHVHDGTEHETRPDATRFSISALSPFAAGAFASALELIESASVARIEARIASGVDALIGCLDEAGVGVLSPRERADRGGIVVARVPGGRAAQAHAALEAEGISATLHGEDRIRLSVHATTSHEMFPVAALFCGR